MKTIDGFSPIERKWIDEFMTAIARGEVFDIDENPCPTPEAAAYTSQLLYDASRYATQQVVKSHDNVW